MAWQSIKDLWNQCAGNRAGNAEKNLEVKKGRRAYFRVTNPLVRQQMKDWLSRRAEAEKAIGDYLRTASPLLGGETPFYRVDQDGYVESINFRYMMGFTHTGWKGKDGTNWMVPEEGTEDGERVKADLRALPPLPSFHDINAAVQWPEAYVDKSFQDMHLPGYEEFAASANREVHVSPSRGEVYVSVPYPERFSDYPKLEQAIAQWRPPEFLERIDGKTGRRIEKRFEFSKSPLGQTVIKALTPLAR